MKQRNKKSQVDPMKVIVLAIILIIVVIIIIMVFRNIFGKQAKGLEEQVSGLSDFDKDGKADFIDPCPCDPVDTQPCGTSATLCKERRNKDS